MYISILILLRITFFTSGRVQVTEDTAKMLEHRYKFEYRDTIFVKGKGKMRTYLLQGKRTDEIES